MELDAFLSAEIRGEIEQRYYARINAQSRFEILSHDPDFMRELARHAGLFADHGVVHVRDVARQLLSVLANAHGILIPRRQPQRLRRMQGYGVLVAYLHDIGMVDFSPFGRAMHPEWACQAVFGSDLNDIIAAIWRENSGNLAWHLTSLASRGILEQEPQVVLREMLSLSLCHSKSKVPVAVLNDPARLRQLMVEAMAADLHHLYHLQRLQRARQRLALGQQVEEMGPAWSRLQAEVEAAETALQSFRQANQPGDGYRNPHLDRYYTDFPNDAFCWLESRRPALQELVEDAVDTLRALRCADALRQRGAVLKTSGGYEVFVDRHTAHAVYALRLGDERLFLLGLPDPISAGEANIAGSELDPSGDLRVSFHRGAFTQLEATEYAAYCAASVIYDIQNDVLGSFHRASDDKPTAGLKDLSQMRILLEEVDDNIEFARLVRQKLLALDPEITVQVHVVPSLQEASERERNLYLSAEPVHWDTETRLQLLAHVSESGHPTDSIDPDQAFNDVGLVCLEASDMLIEAGTPAAFVYIPLGPGLKVIPLGGYQSFAVRPWMPLGLTGVIRGAARNAAVVAARSVRLLMIPKTVYLQHWHQTYSPESFRLAVKAAVAAGPGTDLTVGKLSRIEKSLLLQSVSLFSMLSQDMLLLLAAEVQEVMVANGEAVFEKGTVGDSLYVIIEGTVRVHDGEHTLGRLGLGEVFGEMAALTPEPRMAYVTAVTDVRLLRLSRDSLDRLFDSHSDIARGIIEVLSRRLRTTTKEMMRLRGDRGQEAASRKP